MSCWSMVMLLILVMLVMVVEAVMVVRTGQDRTGRDGTGEVRTGQDRTGQDMRGQDRTKLIFKLNFLGNMWLAAFANLAMFLSHNCLVCLVRDKAQVDRVMRKTATCPLWFWMATPIDVQGKPILRKQKIYMENYL